MEPIRLTPAENLLLAQTSAHFQEIARQNRFPENASVPHDVSRCVICHPELLPLDPRLIYLEVVAQSVLVRRPRLDAELVQAINDDLALQGLPPAVTLPALLAGEPQALGALAAWVRSALATGLELLSIHSPTSEAFDVEEMEAEGLHEAVATKVQEIIARQRCPAPP
jgi:hypothetical protein